MHHLCIRSPVQALLSLLKNDFREQVGDRPLSEDLEGPSRVKSCTRRSDSVWQLHIVPDPFLFFIPRQLITVYLFVLHPSAN